MMEGRHGSLEGVQESRCHHCEWRRLLRAQGDDTGPRPAAHERVAARGTCVSLPLWGARSALGFYAREDHHREGRWYSHCRTSIAKGFFRNGEALWTYLTTPFLLALDGVHVDEAEPWREGAETWCVLRAYFPGSIETHSLVQEFFFGDDMLLRRHDYSVNIAGGFRASQLTSDYVEANGIYLPTTRRAYTCGPDHRPILEMLMVSIDISEVLFEQRDHIGGLQWAPNRKLL